MIPEQDLLEKWRLLSPDKQQQVLEFVEFLHLKTVDLQLLTRTAKSQLGERLRSLRDKIVTAGGPLLNQEEIEKEIASRRGDNS
ncbi:MAG: hypothetical protein RMX68_002950 [Aulosira sp. ZfuVER01]|nr:hypothetical protein [Aulosira sp. ZfuVER01]MDZ7996974.1 hypothetical protein [Aulosira sp. DedVER01a]MDZ8053003.1 hypothetical protein [Aulosira sp. ZfuCHP01]